MRADWERAPTTLRRAFDMGIMGIARWGELLRLVYYQYCCDIPALTHQDIEGAASGRRIHRLKSNAAPGHRKNEVPGRALRLPPGTENHYFRLLRQ